MGLDIMVFRLQREFGPEKPEHKNNFYDYQLGPKGVEEFKVHGFEEFVKPTSCEYIDWKKTFEKFGIEWDENRYINFCIGGEGYTFDDKEHPYTDEASYDDWVKHQLTFKWDDVVTYLEDTPTVYCEEIGYQRKGLYREDRKENFQDILTRHGYDYFVFDLRTLEEVRDHCADDPDSFQKNIIDKYDPRDCVVAFDW